MRSHPRPLRLLTLALLFALTAWGCGEQEPEVGRPRCGPEQPVMCAQADGWPSWALEDVQPDSPRFGQSYGLNTFDGQVVLKAFLVGWCPYCRAQAERLEALRAELAAEGHDVAVVIVHGASANNPKDQQAITSRCTAPVLQDTNDAAVWEASRGGKDDFFIYAPDGTLLHYLPPASGTDLSDPADYATLKARLVEAVEAP